MRVILGIGNPGAVYRLTRHNLGWWVVDGLARHAGVSWAPERRFQAEVADWRRSAEDRVLLVKPTTFVNGSGSSAQALLAYHRCTPADLLVVVDDLALPLGTLRFRANGSAGGHNGLRDIEEKLGQGYPRLRLGCGPLPPGADQVGFVLGGFPPDQAPDAQAMTDKAIRAALAWLNDGASGMPPFNGPLRPPPPRPHPPPNPPPDAPAARSLDLDPP